MDKLDEIFIMQAAFDNSLAIGRGLDYSDVSLEVQHGVLAMVSELAELLDATGSWKWWKNPKPIDRENLLEELVDILHFYVSTCLKAGFTSEDLFDAYIEKNEENYARQEGKSREGYKPISEAKEEKEDGLCGMCQLNRMCARWRQVQDAVIDPITPGKAIVTECEAYVPDTRLISILRGMYDDAGKSATA